MKRPSRPFVVEVRRQRRPPGEATPSWTEEALKSVGGGSRRDEPKLTFEPSPPLVPAAPASAPAKPTGRILPSLVEAPPSPEAAPPAAKAPAKPRVQRRAVRKPALAPKPTPVRFVEPPPAPPVVEYAPAAASGDRSRHRRILARYVFSGALKPGDGWKRRLRGDDK